MNGAVFRNLASERGERAALGWAAVWLVAPLACIGFTAGCTAPDQPPAASEAKEQEPSGPEGPAPGSDPAAIAIAQRMIESMGGWEAWERTRYLRFGFVVERDGERPPISPQHLWDRWTSDYRVEGVRQIEEEPVEGSVLFNLHTREGTAYVHGDEEGWVEVNAETAGGWLEWAYGRFVNDTYWLLMPYKLQDAGVTLRVAASETIDELEYQVVHLSFENVGLTPGDQYWAFIHPETRLMERWAYVLEGQEPPRTEWAWTEWGPYGRLMLSRVKVMQDPQRQMRIIFDPLAVLDSVDVAIFGNPALPMPNP